VATPVERTDDYLLSNFACWAAECAGYEVPEPEHSCVCELLKDFDFPWGFTDDAAGGVWDLLHDRPGEPDFMEKGFASLLERADLDEYPHIAEALDRYQRDKNRDCPEVTAVIGRLRDTAGYIGDKCYEVSFWSSTDPVSSSYSWYANQTWLDHVAHDRMNVLLASKFLPGNIYNGRHPDFLRWRGVNFFMQPQLDQIGKKGGIYTVYGSEILDLIHAHGYFRDGNYLVPDFPVS
jgi:hypothetical protein